MSGLMVGVVVWSVVTVILIGLIIYRSILGSHEDTQVFLDQAEAALEHEQEDVIRQINKIDPVVKLFGAASIGLMLILLATWLYQGFLSSTQLQ